MRKAAQNEREDAIASDEMVGSIKSELKKYKSFKQFLISVNAMIEENDNITIPEYRTEQISNYENIHVNKHKKDSLNDTFVFSDISKRKKTTDEGKKYETGMFMPYLFWSHIFDIIKFGRK